MQPYQQAGETTRHRKESIGNTLKSGAKTAATIIGGGAAIKGSNAILNRIMPFLSDYIPDSLAKKGLEKVDPRLGKFIDLSMDTGKNFGEIKDFLRLKAEGSLAVQERDKALERRNIIQKHSPELHEFILNEVKKGRTPAQAAAALQVSKEHGKYKDIIKKIEKENKTDWLSLLESVYGGAQPTQTQQQPMQEQQAPIQQQSAQNNPIGPGVQKLMQLLQNRQRP